MSIYIGNVAALTLTPIMSDTKASTRSELELVSEPRHKLIRVIIRIRVYVTRAYMDRLFSKRSNVTLLPP